MKIQNNFLKGGSQECHFGIYMTDSQGQWPRIRLTSACQLCRYPPNGHKLHKGPQIWSVTYCVYYLGYIPHNRMHDVVSNILIQIAVCYIATKPIAYTSRFMFKTYNMLGGPF